MGPTLRLVTFCEPKAHSFSGIFLYLLLVLELGHVSIELSQYRVLCMRAAKQILLCLGVISVVIFTFTMAITALTFTIPTPVSHEWAHEWSDTGTILSTLMQLTLGVMDVSELHGMVEDHPLLFATLREDLHHFLLAAFPAGKMFPVGNKKKPGMGRIRTVGVLHHCF